MIVLKEFYKAVENKKNKIQKYEVKISRLLFRLLPLRVKPRNQAQYSYLTICRKSDFDMVKASIYSLCKKSKIQPSKLLLVSDGSWNIKEGEKAFSNFGIDVEAHSWQECADYYSHKCPSLSEWAEKHIWGKKMAAILFFSETQRILFSDPDILWYGTPLSETELEICPFKISIDNCHSYDQRCIDQLHFEYLNDRIPINCGAVWMKGGLSILTDDAIRCIEYEAKNHGNFAEQTAFALVDCKYNNRWPMQEVTSEIDDVVNSYFSKTIFYPHMIARHYLWRLKWIYWKDFVFRIYF